MMMQRDELHSIWIKIALKLHQIHFFLLFHTHTQKVSELYEKKDILYELNNNNSIHIFFYVAPVCFMD